MPPTLTNDTLESLLLPAAVAAGTQLRLPPNDPIDTLAIVMLVLSSTT